MTDLKALAAREAYPLPVPTVDELMNRIGSLAQPYAFELGLDPAATARLIAIVASIAAGIIREAQISNLSAKAVVIRDESV